MRVFCPTPSICRTSDYRTITVLSLFDVLAYVPRDATFAALDMTAFQLMDRIAFLRDSLLTVLRTGLNDDVPEDAEPLNRIARL